MNIELDKIEQMAQGILTQFKKILADEKINASSSLSKSADIAIELNGNKLVISLLLEPYWRWVEYGRRPGKFPPPDAIKDWIKIKSVVPKPYNGKVPNTNQLAFMIGRKIAMIGTEAKHPIQKTVWSKETDIILDNIREEITNQLRQHLLQ